ncbi:hypothetical protein JDV02_003927 [Purpureocillium takamizusanense]|uniref:Zn(2)-C6 fungal-type domain-containing protein n=1 Tax=Purpureocillium takamizusanense TaxID=2060973 RepID=A0A9Q8QDE6_9HYPO|nr:uncharacterized protein JDV02_003927 [Purpureocillium takamizusanense]UNI17595.1 hypothetical protein JDV02_003927 [Purpureocillium takamizusanense]
MDTGGAAAPPPGRSTTAAATAGPRVAGIAITNDGTESGATNVNGHGTGAGAGAAAGHHSAVSPVASSKPKQRRVTQACDYCHQRSIRCRPSGDGVSCANCRDFEQPCTYHRKPRRRGVQPRSSTASSSGPGGGPARGGGGGGGGGGMGGSGGGGPDEPIPRPASGPTPPSTTPNSVGSAAGGGSRPVSVPYRGPNHHAAAAAFARPQQHDVWEAPRIASQAVIVDLVELYFELVYPIFCFFHQPSFTRRISRADYLTSRPLFANTMAVCALVSSRIRDGSVTNPRWDLDSLRDPPPDVFYAEAKRQLIDISPDSSLNVLRAHAILAITAIQNSRIRDMHQHLGTYHTLVAMDALHDESNWPAGIGVIEKEERRRLFWSIYTLDIYTSVVWGGIIRSREQLSNVAYPMEVDDELIEDGSVPDADHSPNSVSSTSTRRALTVRSDCWLSGWNFITDLYRVLEHALTRFRYHSNRSRRQSFLHEIFEDKSTSVTEASVRDSVLQMYLNLPACFKETPQLTYNVKKDLFGYQAANITGSLQLVRMVLFAAGGASIGERCQIVREVVDAFVSVPVSYLVAISTPLLHHLGGIGAFLGSVFEEPLSEADYSQVRDIMLSLAQLLESLEAVHHSASASERLRSQVARIDEFMVSQRQAAAANAAANASAAGPVAMPPNRRPLAPPQAVAAGSYPHMGGPEMADGWSFQVPAEMLGELNWSFEFGQTWNAQV